MVPYGTFCSLCGLYLETLSTPQVVEQTLFLFQIQRRRRAGVGRPPRHGPPPEGGAEGQEERGHRQAHFFLLKKLVKMGQISFRVDVGEKMALSAEEEDSCEEEEEEEGGQKSEDKLK